LDYFRGVAFGVLRIPKSDFLIMTPYEVSLAYQEYLNVEERKGRNDTYRARMIAYTVYCNIPMKRGERMSMGKFWPIDEGDVDTRSKEERKEQYKWLK
jgi:hypothetical protein